MQFVIKFGSCDASDRYSRSCMCCYEHVALYIRYNTKFLWFVALSETWISSWGNLSLSFHVIIRRQIVTETDWSVDSVCLLSLGIPITVTLFANQTPSLFHVCLSVCLSLRLVPQCTAGNFQPILVFPLKGKNLPFLYFCGPYSIST
jgi:hypothetical protein